MNVTHGYSNESWYKTWCHIGGSNGGESRPGKRAYEGVTCSPDWQGDGGIVRFYEEVVVGLNYFVGAELGRIDHDGNYELGNVEWQPSEVNKRVRWERDAHKTLDGRMCTDICRERGVTRAQFDQRIRLLGWSNDLACYFNLNGSTKEGRKILGGVNTSTWKMGDPL